MSTTTQLFQIMNREDKLAEVKKWIRFIKEDKMSYVAEWQLALVKKMSVRAAVRKTA